MKKKLTKMLPIVIAMLTIGSSRAQTFKEDFENLAVPKLPSGWFQWNVDGLTPNSDLSVLNMKNNAWVSFSMDGVNTFATSTSHYAPVGQADDWLVTPPIKPLMGDYLTWDAMSIDDSRKDGYEVRLSTTDSLPSSFTKVLFSIGAENSRVSSHLVDLTAYAGKRIYIAFRNNSNNKFMLALDNVVVARIPKIDASLSKIRPVSGSTEAYAKVGTQISMTVNVVNLGIDTIKSATLKFSDGVNTYSTPMNTAIPFKGQASFSLPSYMIKDLSTTALKAWIETPGDIVFFNDTLKTSITGTSFWPKHRTTVEEATGTWCGWCPRGAVYLDSLHKVKGDDVVLIAVHNNDPMTVAAYDQGLSTFIQGYPSAVTDRKITDDPQNLFPDFEAVKNHCGIGDLKILSIQKGSNMSIKTSAKFAINSSTKDLWRLALVITEDGVTGKTTAYDQHNYYSKYQVDTLRGAGHFWNAEENPVPAAKMTYNHVARYLSAFKGDQGSLPDLLKADSTYTYTFNLTLPSSVIHDWMCTANVLLINQSTGQVVNAVSQRFTPVSVSDISHRKEIIAVPNPSSGLCRIDLKDINIRSLSVINAIGQTVDVPYSYDGTSLTFDLSSLNSGIYTLQITSNDSVFTSKIIRE